MALVAGCADGGAGSTVDVDRIAEVTDGLGYTCDRPVEHGDASDRLCADANGVESLHTVVWSDSDGPERRIEFWRDLVCRGSDSTSVVFAVGENWLVEAQFDLDLPSSPEDRAQAVVDEVGGEVRVLDSSDC